MFYHTYNRPSYCVCAHSVHPFLLEMPFSLVPFSLYQTQAVYAFASCLSRRPLPRVCHSLGPATPEPLLFLLAVVMETNRL